MLDLPGIIEGAKDGKGRGKQVIGVARTCHLILIVLDALKPLTHRKKIEYELEGFGIRLNKKPANITLTKTDKGGISLTSTCNMPPEYTNETVTSVLREYRINNASVSVRDPNATIDDLVDLVQGGVVYTPCLYVLNKVDAITIEELDLLDKVPHYVPISAHHTWNFDELLEKMWEYCDMIRIRRNGCHPRLRPSFEPVETNHGDLWTLFTSHSCEFQVRVGVGEHVKHSPQKVGIGHVLEGGDAVQLVKG